MAQGGGTVDLEHPCNDTLLQFLLRPLCRKETHCCRPVGMVVYTAAVTSNSLLASVPVSKKLRCICALHPLNAILLAASYALRTFIIPSRSVVM